MRAAVDTLRKLNLPLATIYFKVPEENLLREKRTNEAKKELAGRIAKGIRAAKASLASAQTSPSQRKILSITAVPFFDIEYRTVLKIIFKNYDKDLTEVPSNKEFFILNKHIHTFERLFGFKFRENKTMSAINNQSFVGTDLLYPETKDSEPEALDAPQTAHVPRESESYNDMMAVRKSFHVFVEDSTILSDDQAFQVTSTAQRVPAFRPQGLQVVPVLLEEGTRNFLLHHPPSNHWVRGADGGDPGLPRQHLRRLHDAGLWSQGRLFRDG